MIGICSSRGQRGIGNPQHDGHEHQVRPRMVLWIRREIYVNPLARMLIYRSKSTKTQTFSSKTLI